MKKTTRKILTTCAMFFLGTTMAFSQIPPEQKTVVIEPGVPGIIESTINADTIAGGLRANPNRIYMLKKDAFYTMTSPILFGGEKDSTSTLIIIGEEGGKKPIIISSPRDDGDMFRSIVNGNLKLQNLYWPSMATNGTGNALFEFAGTNLRLEVYDFVGGNQVSSDMFITNNVKGTVSYYFKNCYFRDVSNFANPWNFAIIRRSDARPIDTLWVENVTVANGGLLFLASGSPVNFGYFNHNTIMNVPKYWLYMEQWKEGYFANNIMINCNWQGEVQEMMMSQKQSQKERGPHPVGLIDIMEPTQQYWENAFGAGSTPAIEDIKWMASNNLSFTSPFLDKYYRGEFNDVADHPISNIDWGFSAAAGLALPKPHPVVNIPTMFFSHITEGLIETYNGIKADNNHHNVDPLMVTNVIPDQTVGDAYAIWARRNYQVASPGETMPARTVFSIGDYNPTTVPGPEGENGSGFSNIRELPEDFTYTADIRSTINSRPLGALGWWQGGLDNWDSQAEFEKVKNYYDGVTSVDNTIKKIAPDFTIHPNPAKDILNLNSKSELSEVVISDIKGSIVKRVSLNGSFNSSIDISTLNNGMFIISVKTIDGKTSVGKFIKN
jgi:hypothetical protein